MKGRERAGVALFAALVFTVVIALLLAGAVASTTLVQRSSRLVGTELTASAAADAALGALLSDPDAYGLADLQLGKPSQFKPPSWPGDFAVTVSAVRLPGSTLWLESSASSPDGATRRRFNMVARFPFAGLLAPAGMLSRGDVKIGHDVVLLGDTSSDAECARPIPVDAVVAPGARATGVTSSGDSVRFAIQPVALDSNQYRITARQLTGLDSVHRIVHVRGDTVITGGSFDGVFVADGSVAIVGPFRMRGLLSARGRITATAGSFGLVGSMMAFAPLSPNPSIDLAGATVTYSACAVDRALRMAFPPRQVPKRSWAEIF